MTHRVLSASAIPDRAFAGAVVEPGHGTNGHWAAMDDELGQPSFS